VGNSYSMLANQTLAFAVAVVFAVIRVNGNYIRYDDNQGYIAEDEFSYEDTDAWPRKYCGGSAQSPINIDSIETVNRHSNPLKFENYDAKFETMEISTNGHTVVFRYVGEKKKPEISGGGLNDVYIFDSLHFHWGSNSSLGSEHTIKGQRFAGEIHLVHYNSKYENLKKALTYHDGLAVVAVLLQVGDADNEALQPIIDQVANVNMANKYHKLFDAVTLDSFLPADSLVFIRYQGSLTTPRCNEVVTWSILWPPVTLSENQISAFRNSPLKSNNFRPTQKLNDRQLQFYRL